MVDEGARTPPLDEFLAQQGVDRAALTATVDSVVGRRSGDRLLAVGSIVEGLGNRKSDLDLLLVTDRDEDVAEQERGWTVGRGLVDLRVVRRTTVDRLTDRLAQWARRPWNLVELAPFSYDERLLLHRLVNGVDLDPARSGPAEPHSGGVAAWPPLRPALIRLKLQVGATWPARSRWTWSATARSATTCRSPSRRRICSGTVSTGCSPATG